MERDVFLSRVARASMTAKIPAPPSVPGHLPELDRQDLVTLFRQRAIDVDAVVHGPVSRHGAPRAVTGIASGHQAETFLAWDDLPASGVASALIANGLTRIEHDAPNRDRNARLAEYRSVDMGITGAYAGLAESGSVVLTHGPGRPRMASLVPEIHVARLETKLLDRTLAHWSLKHSDVVAETANLVLVTGPSRTGDIELQLNLGVHGPRHLHVVLIK